MTVTIYHNPRCSKSRATLELVRSRGYAPKVIEYLKNPPSASALDRILKLLGYTPRELMRRSETPYKGRRLDDPDLSRKELIAAMVADPILIERPIVVTPNGAAVGRPPGNVLEIL